MKALTLAASGGLEQLRVQELPEPAIQSPTDVLVQVRTAALNRLDLFVAAGLARRGLGVSPCGGLGRSGSGARGRRGCPTVAAR